MAEPETKSVLELWVKGTRFRLASLELYPEERVLEWRRLTNEGAQKLGPVSTGIGLIGSAGWVIGGSIALGAIEGLLTSAAQREGLHILQYAGKLYRELLTLGRLVPVSQVGRLGEPDPNLWRATVADREILDPRSITSSHYSNASNRRPLTLGVDAESIPEKIVERNYLNLSSEFVSGLDIDEGAISLRWSSVDALKYNTSQLMVPNPPRSG